MKQSFCLAANVKTREADDSIHLDLLNDLCLRSLDNPWILRAAYSLTDGNNSFQTRDPLPSIFSSLEIPADVPDLDVNRLRKILRFNAFGDSDHNKTTEQSSSLYFYASFANHSCVPNTRWYKLGSRIIFRAVRDIPKNTEIFIAYRGFGPNSEIKQRREQLKHWNFVCGCELCSFEEQYTSQLVTFRDKDIAPILNQAQNLMQKHNFKASYALFDQMCQKINGFAKVISSDNIRLFRFVQGLFIASFFGKRQCALNLRYRNLEEIMNQIDEILKEFTPGSRLHFLVSNESHDFCRKNQAYENALKRLAKLMYGVDDLEVALKFEKHVAKSHQDVS